MSGNVARGKLGRKYTVSDKPEQTVSCDTRHVAGQVPNGYLVPACFVNRVGLLGTIARLPDCYNQLRDVFGDGIIEVDVTGLDQKRVDRE